jgi:hypothetical protein
LGDEAIDIWAVHPDGLVDIRVKNDEELALVEKAFGECNVVIEDMENFIEEHEFPEVERSGAPEDWFLDYHTYNDTKQWYSDLARQFPNQARYVGTIGRSFEGRDMPAFHIAGNVNQVRPTKGYIYCQCLIHAREWISGGVCQWIAYNLLNQYSTVPFVTSLLDQLEIVFVPFVNPDGYEYTWTNDRMWRKNRRPNQGSTCAGTDLNRNYPEKWGNGGGSTNPCSETYEGTAANSEIETQNTILYYNSLANKAVVNGMIDWHSYGQLINRPWGWTPNDCPDEDVIRSIGDKYVSDVLNVHRKVYVNQKAYQLYETSGTSRDYFYGNGSQMANNGFRSVSWTIELRPTSSNPGFRLPPVEIIPTGQENYAGFLNYLNWFIVNGALPIKD